MAENNALDYLLVFIVGILFGAMITVVASLPQYGVSAGDLVATLSSFEALLGLTLIFVLSIAPVAVFLLFTSDTVNKYLTSVQ